MSFSERYGLTPKKALQIDGIDENLRLRLWNFIYDVFLVPENSLLSPKRREDLEKYIWKEFLNLKIDNYYLTQKISYPGIVNSFKLEFETWFFNCNWYQIFDLIEITIRVVYFEKNEKNQYLKDRFNYILEKENFGYRIIDFFVTPVTSKIEINEIEEALEVVPSFESVNVHLSTALKHLSDKVNPDYRNSIKESISAVESACKIITNEPKKTLGDALNILKKQNTIDNGLISGLHTLWGWSSNVARHGQNQPVECTFADAKLILVMSSGIVNYLKMLKKD